MSQSPAPLRIRPWRWILPLLTLGVIVVGLPATSASAAADGVLKGTVTFHESTPDRTLTAYHETTDGTWVSDSSSVVSVSSTGTYSVSVPGGVPVKLRVSFGSPDYSYWYGDGFTADSATAVTAPAGQTVSGINLSVPEPISYSGRLVDRGGKPVAGAVIPTVNTDGASVPLLSAPIAVDSSGGYQVFLPARSGNVYEGGVMATTESGDAWSWLGGGDGYEPNYYLNPHPGDAFANQNIELPLGTASVAPDKNQGTTTALRATKTPVVRGAVRKGHVLRSTAGSYNKRPTTVRYQWLRNGKAIAGAHTATYKLRKADVRKHIRVRVTAYSGRSKVLATSARTAAIRAR